MALTEEENRVITEIYGEIAANFTITEMPAGGAPDEIKMEWIGVTMPVRSSQLGRKALEDCIHFDALTSRVVATSEPVGIIGLEAIESLRDTGKDEAAEFWLPYGLAKFVFGGNEGFLEPIGPLQHY